MQNEREMLYNAFPSAGLRELYFCYHLAKIFLAFLHIMSGEVISRLYARKNKKCP